MNICIIGAGSAGIICGIMLKLSHKHDDVFIIDHNAKPLKKFCATGNGRCNLANSGSIVEKYSNSTFCEPILEEFTYKQIIDFLNNIGIKTTAINDLIYPYSLSAKSLADLLIKKCDELNIKLILNTNVINYDDTKIFTNCGDFPYDKLIISTGGKASSKHGSDGSMFDILKKHSYQLTKMYPGLCPIKVKESTKDIANERLKCMVTLTSHGQIVHSESGEVLFKKDGLSGIVIMNLSSLIAKLKDKDDVEIILDCLPDYCLSDLTNELLEISKARTNVLEAFFSEKLVKYLTPLHFFDRRMILGKKEYFELAKTIKWKSFTFKDFYPFEDAQVCVGGVELSQINSLTLESNIEKNVYFIGEILDIDGLCGGYNLMWCFASSNKVAQSI